MSTPAVTFVYDDWVAEFPAFSYLTEGQATGYFNRACTLVANDTCNPAFGDGILTQILYLATAHIAKLNAPTAGGLDPAGLVGRISNASEGSVSVAVELNGSGSPSEAYWTQTTYGFEYWQATAQYRTFRYSARPTRVVNGAFPSVPRGGW